MTPPPHAGRENPDTHFPDLAAPEPTRGVIHLLSIDYYLLLKQVRFESGLVEEDIARYPLPMRP